MCYKEKEQQYWERIIAGNVGNPKRLWQKMSTLMGRTKESSTKSTPSFKPDDYLDFLESKVQQVRDETSGSPPPSFEATAHSFSVLQPCSVEDLERVIMSSPAKSCELDPIPTFLLREFLKDLLPFIHLMCNSSISAGLLPSSQKKAVVTPAIKKRGLDSEVMNNYRPISNLSFLSKIMEKIVSKQLLDYLNGHELLPKFQSGFRSGHSTETVLIRLLSDIYSAMDKGQVTLLALLDVSAAFDSVDHDILMQRLEKSFGFGGQVLSWLESFIRDRTQSVTIGGSHSVWRRIRFGVPQGSVLGPLLYVLFTAGVPGLVQSLGAGVQQYADDTQAYLHRTAEQAVAAMVELTRILESVEDWMRSNRMKLNPAKTQYIWIGGSYQLNKIDHAELAARFPDIQFLKTVMDLGVTIDQELNMTAHVGCISRSGFYQLRQLRQVRRSLSEKAAHTLVHAFVVTRIDYCNAVLHGITKREMDRVQRILNAAARLLLAIPRQSHISAAIRDNLHWLPSVERVRFKVLTVVWNCLHGNAPLYLRELCMLSSSVPGRRNLRSADNLQLVVPDFKSTRMQRRGFAVAGPLAWNSLKPTFRGRFAGDESSAAVFKRHLKTYLFGSV